MDNSTSPTSSQSPQGACLYHQGRLLQFTRAGAGSPRSGGGPRGKVTAFSAGARRRMLQWLSIVDWPSMVSAEPAQFVTLTTPPEYWDGPGAVRAPLARFRRRLEYHLAGLARPDYVAVWKMERGEKRGMLHFHLLVLGAPSLPEAWLRRAWKASLRWSSEKDVICAVEACACPERVGKYLAKYVGKATPAQVTSADVRRSPDNPEVAGAAERDSPCLSHITGEKVEETDKLNGRWWGVWHKEAVKYAEIAIIGDGSTKSAAVARRIVRRWRQAQLLQSILAAASKDRGQVLQSWEVGNACAFAARKYRKRSNSPPVEGERPSYDALLRGRLTGFTVYGSAGVLQRIATAAA